jgi:transcriptional regulator with XRE-family HTH domain
VLDTEKIKSRREKLGLTMDEAAKVAGFKGRQHWYMIESGRRQNIELETLAALAAALKCDPKSLLR